MENQYINYHKFRGNNIYKLSADLPYYFLNVLPKDREILILDIGCGNGEMLYALKKRGYKHIQGIDLDGEAVRRVRKNGIPCEKINVLDYKPGKKFDFITMNHVLEHLPKQEVIDLLWFIREKLLSSSGELMLRVPNAQAYTGCYWAYEDFTHETLYTAGSLKYVLKSAGYNMVRFIDVDGTEGDTVKWVKGFKKCMIHFYAKKLDFWNFITGGSFHKPSPRIYTWEIKVLAK